MQPITAQTVKNWGHQLGFDRVGIAPAVPVDAQRQVAYHDYLADGRFGEMTYLARNVAMRLDPRKLLPGAQSIICVAVNYYYADTPPDQPDDSAGIPPAPATATGESKQPQRTGKVARYAWGRDYHHVIKSRLKTLSRKIQQAAPQTRLRCFVDTAPLAEREHAARAGIGWIGKHGLVLHQKIGSWLLLGSLLTDLSLEPDTPATDHCGSCTRCLDACPTDAFIGPQQLDPRKCISYLTIESRKPIPDRLKHPTGNWIFGCDVCQEVCPFNRRAPQTQDADFAPRPQWSAIDLHQARSFTDASFSQRFTGSALERTSAAHLADVAEVCRENLQNNRGQGPSDPL